MPPTLLQQVHPLSEPFVLGLELPLRHLYLVSILDGVVDKVESIVGAISFLFDDCHVLSKGLLCIL